MLIYILRRVAIAVPLVLVIITLAFALVSIMPTDVTTTVLGTDATVAQREALRAQLGLDQPPLVQYFSYLGQVLTGNLGTSLVSGRSVIDEVITRLPVTLTLAMGGTVLCFLIGTVLGSIAARRGGAADTSVRVGASVLLAIPSFWLAVLLVLVFAVILRVLPASGWTPFGVDPGSWAEHLILPLAAIALGSSASIARQTRVAMLANLSKDYISTLRAAGIGEFSVVYKHALRNAAIPVLTVIGLQFVGLFGGAVLIEQVFALPGVGQLALTAVTTGDIPVILGVVVSTSVLILAMNILIDVLYAILNPKARTA